MEMKLSNLADATDLIVINPIDAPIHREACLAAASAALRGKMPRFLCLLPARNRPTTDAEWQQATTAQAEWVAKLKTELRLLGKAPRVHVFAHSPIPLAFHLGYLLSGWTDLVPYQYDRDRSSWAAWVGERSSDPSCVVEKIGFRSTQIPPPAGDLPFAVEGLPEGIDKGNGVGAIIVSVTHDASSAAEETVAPLSPIAKIHLRARNVGHRAVRTPEDARSASRQFREVLDKVVHLRPSMKSLHVFYAGPLGLAMLLGREVNPNVHPPLVVYDHKAREHPPYKAAVQLTSKSAKVIETKLLEDRKALVAEFRQSYTEPKLPILRMCSQDIGTRVGRVLEGKIGILVLHFLSDLIPVLDALGKLGLDPAATFLVRKPYHYRNREGLTAHLRDQGYRIFTSDRPIDNVFAGDVLNHVRAAMTNTGSKEFFILEDGGYFAPLLHAAEFADLRSRCIGAVEQTTKGIRRDEAITEPAFPIVNIAKSKLKKYLEAPAVGEALAEILTTVVQDREQWHVPDTRVLVIGYGSVGEKLSEALLSHRFKVTVYDSDRLRRTKAKEARIAPDVIDTLESLDSYQIIVGTTGQTSLGRDQFLSMAHNVILVSGSSDRLEVDVDALSSLVQDPEKQIWMDGDYTIYRLMKQNREIRVLCDGYPVNFVLGEGIAKAVIDPILAELVAGVAQLFQQPRPEHGIIDLPEAIETEIQNLFSRYHQP